MFGQIYDGCGFGWPPSEINKLALKDIQFYQEELLKTIQAKAGK